MNSCQLGIISCVEFWNLLSTLVPLVTLCAGVFLAYKQLKQSSRDVKVSIAKNHYRDTLNLFLENSDVVYLGTNAVSYGNLVKDISAFRRYRWLFSITMFALQELYQVFVAGPMKDKHWEKTILIIASVFKEHFNSETNFPDYIRNGYNKSFLEFVSAGIQKMEHPTAATALSKVLKGKLQ